MPNDLHFTAITIDQTHWSRLRRKSPVIDCKVRNDVIEFRIYWIWSLSAMRCWQYSMIYVDNWQSIRNTIDCVVPVIALQIWRFISVSWSFLVFLLERRVYGIFFFVSAVNVNVWNKPEKNIVVMFCCAVPFFLSKNSHIDCEYAVSMQFSFTYDLNECARSKLSLINILHSKLKKI